MATVSITNQEWRGDLLIACKMDGTSVHLIDGDWSAKDTAEIMAKTGTGALILAAFIPGGLLLGGIIGALSKLLTRLETGYYDANKNLVYTGRLYKSDLF